MSLSDIRHIKQLARRLGARESDVIRFAIKTMLERLSPLQDPKASGRSLVPVFMESGAELIRHFELDAGSLSGIINDGVEDARHVEPDDIQLLALTGTRRSLLQLRIPGAHPAHVTEAAGEGTPGAGNGSTDHDTLEKSLRRYLYEKYLFGGPGPLSNGPGSAA
jgi:hypothetical protein